MLQEMKFDWVRERESKTFVTFIFTLWQLKISKGILLGNETYLADIKSRFK